MVRVAVWEVGLWCRDVLTEFPDGLQKSVEKVSGKIKEDCECVVDGTKYRGAERWACPWRAVVQVLGLSWGLVLGFEEHIHAAVRGLT